MKKAISLILVLVMCLSLCACGDQKAFEASKAAYDNIDIAYEITEQFGSDIYEAWRLGIFDKDAILANGVKYLDSGLSLSEDEIRMGVAYVTVELRGEKWADVSEEEKKIFADNADDFLGMMGDSMFSFCVMAVNGAYIANGKVEEAQTALDTAKLQMKDLSEKYSDYEHYPNLKGYFTTTSSFFEFCQDPTGSFEQIKDTINQYKNDARDYVSDLDYIFEE